MKLITSTFRPTENCVYCVCIHVTVLILYLKAMALLVCKENLEPYLAKLEPTRLLLRIKPYLWLISPVFLIITFLVYAILPEIRNRLIVMCHVASLATTFVVLGVRGIWQQHGSKPDDPICILIGTVWMDLNFVITDLT